MNVLAEYLAKPGPGRSASAVARRAQVQWRTIRDIAAGRVTPRVKTAKAIEEATGGEAPAAALLGLDTVTTSADSAADTPADSCDTDSQSGEAA